MLWLPRYWRKPVFCFYPKFLESFNQRSFTAEHLRKEMFKGNLCFSKRGWLSHDHKSSVFVPCYRKEFWPSFEVNQPVPQRFCHNLSAEFWYQKWVGRNTVPFHSCKSCSFCRSPEFILFWITQGPAGTLALEPGIHQAAFVWHCIHTWLFGVGMMVCKHPAVSGLSMGSTGPAVFAAQLWLQLIWHNAHNEWVIQKLLQDSSWQSWFWIRAFWISVQRNLWISWQLEKKSVESNFLWAEKGEEEDYQWAVLYLRMKRTVIPTKKVTFILFSVHCLYNFSEKSVKEHHSRPETKWELILLVVWSVFFWSW